MRHTLTALAAAFAVLSAPAAWGQGDAKAKSLTEAVAKDLKALEGTWEIVFVEVQGKKGPLPEGRRERLTFRGAGFTVMQGEEVRDKGALKIDPTKKPKAMDMTPAGGAGKAGASLAIYELKGDELRVCAAPPGQPRPAAFTTAAGSSRYITTLRRVNPKP